MGSVHQKIGRCFEESEPDDENDSSETPHVKILHYYIEQLDDGTIALELIDEDGNPTGEITEEGLDLDYFSARYKSCSEHECPLQPRTIEEIAKKMAEIRADMGEDHLDNGEIEQAEDKFNRSLKFDDENLKAQIGMGKTKLEQKKVEEALKIFKEISDSNAIFEQASKHTFNEFAIYLRKKEIFDQAIENYEKAIVIDPYDEVLYYNLGRAYWEREDVQTAIEKLKEGLKVADEKKLKFTENLDIQSENPEIDNEKSYLDETYNAAHLALDFFIKGEKEMLQKLFSKHFGKRNYTNDNELLKLTSTFLDLLKKDGSDENIEDRISLLNHLENVKGEFMEQRPNNQKIHKWLVKAKGNAGNLELTGKTGEMADKLFHSLGRSGRKPKLDA